MAFIVPFRGILYNPEKVNDISAVVAPPYDVIDEEGQERLYNRHPHNIVRLILGKELPGDDARKNKYLRAADYLKAWISQKILVKDSRPCIYLYTQLYQVKSGIKKERKGFVALIRLEDFDAGVVFPHEETFPKTREDRFRLISATRMQFNPIFSLFSSPGKGVDRHFDGICDNPPIFSIVDEDGVDHRLWRVEDPERIRKIAEEMEDKPVFIADGHHRYETALRYRNTLRKTDPGYCQERPYNYVMMYFSNMDDEGLSVFPTHKLVFGLKGLDPEGFLSSLKDDFHVEIFPFNNSSETRTRERFLAQMEHKGKAGNVFGLCIKGHTKYYLLSLKDKDILERRFKGDIPECLRELDVTVLHKLIFKQRLGIDDVDLREGRHVRYIHGASEAILSVQNGSEQMGFLMNPTKLEELRKAARALCKMPQKSTYFFPKLLSGLVMNQVTG